MTEGAGKEKCQKKDREKGAGKETGVGVDPRDPHPLLALEGGRGGQNYWVPV